MYGNFGYDLYLAQKHIHYNVYYTSHFSVTML